LKKILDSLTKAEPFMKCTEGAALFYQHFATVALLYGAPDLACDLSRRALAINPRLREAKELLGHAERETHNRHETK
jgi:hypothetical protein